MTPFVILITNIGFIIWHDHHTNTQPASLMGDNFRWSLKMKNIRNCICTKCSMRALLLCICAKCYEIGSQEKSSQFDCSPEILKFLDAEQLTTTTTTITITTIRSLWAIFCQCAHANTERVWVHNQYLHCPWTVLAHILNPA